MKEISVAIYNEYTGSDLAASCNDMYSAFAEETATEPYITFDFVAGTPDYMFDTRHEEVVVQFNIFSDKSSVVEVNELYDKLKNLYDDCKLAVSGYLFVDMRREMSQQIRDIEEGVWQYIIQYRILIEAI